MNNIKQHKHLILLAIALLIAYAGFHAREYYIAISDLPILGETSRDAAGNAIHHTIAPFETINQRGETIRHTDLLGKIHVANFFFTSCPVICPEITQNLREVQANLDIPILEFISFSIDPKRDTVERLKSFAERMRVDESNWNFVVADKADIYLLARNSYFLVAVEGSPEKNDFIHSEQVALVDKDLRIRGFYDGMDPVEMRNLQRDVKKLYNSYAEDGYAGQ